MITRKRANKAVIAMQIVEEISFDDSYLFRICGLKYDFDDIFRRLEDIPKGEWSRGVVFGRPVAREQMWFNIDGKSMVDFSPWKNVNKDDEGFSRWNSHDYSKYGWLLEFQQILEKDICDIVKNIVGEGFNGFNSVLLNRYVGRDDYIKYHRDCEYIFGDNPMIVSVSFGQKRTFSVRKILYKPDNPSSVVFDGEWEKNIELGHGDIIVMMGRFQKNFAHGVLKGDMDGVRYNMTFRYACGNV